MVMLVLITTIVVCMLYVLQWQENFWNIPKWWAMICLHLGKFKRVKKNFYSFVFYWILFFQAMVSWIKVMISRSNKLFLSKIIIPIMPLSAGFDTYTFLFTFSDQETNGHFVQCVGIKLIEQEKLPMSNLMQQIKKPLLLYL